MSDSRVSCTRDDRTHLAVVDRHLDGPVAGVETNEAGCGMGSGSVGTLLSFLPGQVTCPNCLKLARLLGMDMERGRYDEI